MKSALHRRLSHYDLRFTPVARIGKVHPDFQENC
jgi:hypothetical protein